MLGGIPTRTRAGPPGMSDPAAPGTGRVSEGPSLGDVDVVGGGRAVVIIEVDSHGFSMHPPGARNGPE